MEVQAWLAKAGNPETSAQLKSMVATLEKEAEVNRKKLKNRSSLMEDLEKANTERRSATASLEVPPHPTHTQHTDHHPLAPSLLCTTGYACVGSTSNARGVVYSTAL